MPLRRRVVIRRNAPRALAQGLFQRGRPVVFPQEVEEGLVGEGSHAPTRVDSEQLERLKNLGRELDDLAP